MQQMADRIRLCSLEEIRLPGSRGMTVSCGNHVHDIFLVRNPAGLFGYLNSCPHTGAPLDWMPDQFLSMDASHIQCATHAALFNLHDGVCIAGPCSGEALVPVPLVVDAGVVYFLRHAFCARQRPAVQA